MIGGQMKISNLLGLQAKLTSRGRITIPAEIRKKNKIKPGMKIHFQDEGNRIKMIFKKKF